MRSSTDLVAKKMLGCAHRPLAEQSIIQIGPVHCQIVELLRKWQRSTVSTAPGVKEIQTSECAQLVLGVAEALRNIERLRKRCTHLGNFRRRRAQRGVQPHFLAWVLRSAGPESADRLLGASAALLQQRQAYPERDRRCSERHSDRSITPRRQRPVKRPAQIVD